MKKSKKIDEIKNILQNIIELRDYEDRKKLLNETLNKLHHLMEDKNIQKYSY